MNIWTTICWALLLWPSLLVSVDASAALRARFSENPTDAQRPRPVVDDFEVLVPIYGSIRYLENAEWLAAYGRRVLLCTTDGETADFDADINAIAARYSFRVFRGSVDRRSSGSARSTAGVVRDRVIRDALVHVSAPWVVCLDADTTTSRPLGELIGEMAERDLDFASIRLVPTGDGLLAHLQKYEYRLAMTVRQIIPWLVSGACHAARTDVHRQVMARHSLFFQGNDVEVGYLADALGYRVGHVLFDVPTSVPTRVWPWLRQRYAWAGGEWRLFIANPHIALRHPLFWLYGAIIAIVGFPFRWLSLFSPSWPLLAVFVAYIAALWLLHRSHAHPAMFAYPFYLAFSSLILTPLGLISYVHQAVSSRNLGRIRLRRMRGPFASARHS